MTRNSLRYTLFAAAVLASLVAVAGTTPLLPVFDPAEELNLLALSAAIILWIAYFNASIHYRVATEIQLRVDRMQDELAERQSELLRRIDRHFDQVDLLRTVLGEIDREQKDHERQLASFEDDGGPPIAS